MVVAEVEGKRMGGVIGRIIFGEGGRLACWDRVLGIDVPR